MYKLEVKKDFIAQHFLIGGDWGAENQKHSHHYRIEIQLTGKDLDAHGFVVDIVEVNNQLEKLISAYRDRTLNDLPEFKGLNPSIENLARISYQALSQPIHRVGISDFKVRVWEDEIASVSYRED
jgi:6-pyruvoyltetrahydropterin/6-carboxytetrahydropterin synthase